MDKILRINMGADGGPKAKSEPVGSYAGLGGRALTSTIIAKEVPPLCHPLGEENKLVIAPGLLSGSAAAMSGRISVGCKSPLTGGIKEANAGGMAAQMLGRLGIAAIVLEGKPKDGTLYKVSISKDKMKLTGASIAFTDMEFRPTRHAGRGGVGAVMGSKGVKVIVVDDAGCAVRSPKEPDKFKEANKAWVAGLRKHPVTGQGLPTYGTNVLTNVINEAGAYPTKNFMWGRFDGCSKIIGETQAETENARGGEGSATHGCHRGCVIRCSGTYYDKDGHYLTKQPEYETVWAHGGNCGIDDLDAIAMLDRLDDDFGLDTIEMGAAIGVAMEAGVAKFGDAQAAINLVKEVGKGTPLGRILGSGAGLTGKVFGVERVPVVKNQAMPAYDPRGVQGIGVTYATTTQGADHTAGYAVTANILGVGGKVDALKPEGQIELSRNLQIATAAIDSTGMCLFIAFAILDQPETFQALLDLLGSFGGQKLTGDDVVGLGKSILKMERDFNTKAGFTKEMDRLPDYFKKEKLAPHNVTFMVTDSELDQVYNW